MSSSDASGAMSNTSLLPNRTVVAVKGEDAPVFLQGLITNDINKVKPGVAIFAALLSPQGKFLHDFFIVEHEGSLLLDTARATLPDLIKRLSMYKLRAKVEIAEIAEMRVGTKWGGEPQAANRVEEGARVRGGAKKLDKVSGDNPAGEISRSEIGGSVPPIIKYQDPRLPELGNRYIIYDSQLSVHHDENAYNLHRLKLGVPEGAVDLVYNRSFPMQWGYDKLNAIDFNKGCYVGQEVTARSKHLGEMRKLVHQVTSDKPLPPKDTPIMAGGKEAGTMAGSAGNIGLAMLNIEMINSGTPLYAGETEVKATLPSWLK